MRYVLKSKGAFSLDKWVRSVDLDEYDVLVYCAMLAVGVYGMLRIGEVCFQKTKKITKFIANRDISLLRDHMKIVLHYPGQC